MPRRKINKVNTYPTHTTYRKLHSVLRDATGCLVFSVVTPTTIVYHRTSITDIPTIVPNKHGQRTFTKQYLSYLETKVTDTNYTGLLFMYCKHELVQVLRPVEQFTTITPSLWKIPSTAYRHVCIGLNNGHPICLKPICKESKRIYANKGKAGNQTRTKNQHIEDTGARFRTKIIEAALTGPRPKIDYDKVYTKFQGKCFNCAHPIAYDNTHIGRQAHLDHTLPHSFYYPYTTDTITLLCAVCNLAKRNKWPSIFYSNEQLIQLEHLTGLSLNKPPQYNIPIFVALYNNFDIIMQRLLHRFRKHPIEQKHILIQKLLNDIRKASILHPNEVVFKELLTMLEKTTV